MVATRQCTRLVYLVTAGVVTGFAPPRTTVQLKSSAWKLLKQSVDRRRDCSVHERGSLDSYDNDASSENQPQVQSSRRTFLQLGLSTGLASPLFIPPQTAEAVGQLPTDGAVSSPNLKCLLDLPPVDSDSVRIYLCRHGQTENNRLHLVQGARVDPPLNDTGRSMAQRLGAALSFLPDGMAPTVAAHSLLRRAKETATVADATVGEIRASTSVTRANGASGGFEKEPLGITPVSNTFLPDGEAGFSPSGLPLNLQAIPSLGEVDFGATIEGRPSNEVRAGMYATYAAWSAGNVDQVMDGEGESGRQVLFRAANALNTLADVASKTGGSVVAVSHSTYLRMLLSTVMNIPLAQGAMLEQKNGCINVLDVNIKRPMKELGPKSELFGGKLSMARDFSLAIPETKIVRVNEIRHLHGLV